LNRELDLARLLENPSLHSTRTLANTLTHDNDGHSKVHVTWLKSIFSSRHSMLDLQAKRKSLAEKIFSSFYNFQEKDLSE
jgi:hypothetical protein